MTLFEVLRRHGIKTGIITAAIVVIIVIVAVTCLTRKPEKGENVSTNSSTVKTNKASVATPKPESTDKYSGSSSLFKGFKYVGNSQSKVYHVADGSCPVADKIKPDHIVKFDSKDKARRSGYERCEICKP
jgi:hypothetical protein